MEFTELLAAARLAREQAYAPYSRFSVGAALSTAGGKVFTGCNVENLSFGLTICAERAAVSAAVTGGEREFTRLAVISDSKTPVSPCGACRQVLAEFAPNIEIQSSTLGGETFTASLAELLPRPAAGILGT